MLVKEVLLAMKPVPQGPVPLMWWLFLEVPEISRGQKDGGKLEDAHSPNITFLFKVIS